jgi:hypothetical protein
LSGTRWRLLGSVLEGREASVTAESFWILRDLRLADRDAVRFLRGCEADGMKVENCPAYIREWMDREED